MKHGDNPHSMAIRKMFRDVYHIDTNILTIKDLSRLTIEQNYMGELIITMPKDLAAKLSKDTVKKLRKNLKLALYSSMDKTYFSPFGITVDSLIEFITNLKAST